MQIIKSLAIIIAVIIAMIGIGQQTVQATSDNEKFIVRVNVDGIDSLTKRLDVTIRGGDGEAYGKIIDPFSEGIAGK